MQRNHFTDKNQTPRPFQSKYFAYVVDTFSYAKCMKVFN